MYYPSLGSHRLDNLGGYKFVPWCGPLVCACAGHVMLQSGSSWAFRLPWQHYVILIKIAPQESLNVLHRPVTVYVDGAPES